MLICICTEVSSAHRGESTLKDEAQVSGLPLNETARGLHKRDLFRIKRNYSTTERCISMNRWKERTCLKRFDKQNKFNLDMESKSISFQNKILKRKQGWKRLKKIILWVEKRIYECLLPLVYHFMISCIFTTCSVGVLRGGAVHLDGKMNKMHPPC